MRVEVHICGVGAIGDDGDGVLIYSESRKRVSRVESLQIRKPETGNQRRVWLNRFGLQYDSCVCVGSSVAVNLGLWTGFGEGDGDSSAVEVMKRSSVL